MKERNGFSMIEVLVASTILFQMLLILIPIHSNIQASKDILSERRWAAIKLQEELQPFINEKGILLPAAFERVHEGNNFSFRFEQENDYVKGCVNWINGKEMEETFCLYGLPEQ